MNRLALRVTRYRFRATFRHRRGGYLALVVLLGSIGGLAMGSLAAARRTQSSFDTFLASTDPSDLLVYHDDSRDLDNSGDPAFLRGIARLAHVRSVESADFPTVLPLGTDGLPATDPQHQLFASTVPMLGSIDGLFYDRDRPSVIRGRLADPSRADEMVMTADAADLLGLEVGEAADFAFYTNHQATLGAYGTGSQHPQRRISIRLVGIVVFSNGVVRDDIDRAGGLALLTPALTDGLTRCCANSVFSGLQLDHGRHDVVAVADEIEQAFPNTSVLTVTSDVEATAQRAIEPEAIAIAVFGGIAALATVLIAAQVIGRQLRVGGQERDTLRALGASPAMTALDGVAGTVGAVVVGSLLAVTVALALSPLAPLGAVRPVYPSLGLAFDGTVIGLGFVVLVVGLGAYTVAVAVRSTPHRLDRQRGNGARPSTVGRAAAVSGLSLPAVTGIRFAVAPGGRQNTAPVRSAILGAALAVLVVTATLTFGASLDALVSHPALFGWNWDYELLGPYGGFADVPQPQVGRRLDQDEDVEAWAGAYFDILRIDGQAVPVLGMHPGAPVQPRVLSGHGLEGSGDIVLGTATLSALDKEVGDRVEVSRRDQAPTQLVIAGTATLPAIGATHSRHLEIGTGAVLSDALIPSADKGFGDLPGSPEAIFVRLRSTADPAAARATLDRIAAGSDVLGHGPPTVVPVQRPAEIVNYGALGTTPIYLGAALAVGAVSALALTLIASVRRRRHDLALLKTLGFTRRQLAAVVAWQSTVAVAVGTMVGVPVGIVLGRWLWVLFARQIHVVPAASVPTASIAVVVVGAFVVANLVAAMPGIRAARTRTALLLRAE